MELKIQHYISLNFANFCNLDKAQNMSPEVRGDPLSKSKNFQNKLTGYDN